MNQGTLKLRTEQLIRNRLWRHSVKIREDCSGAGTTEILETLFTGLRARPEVDNHAYVVLPEGAVDRIFLRAVERSECPRFPLMGDFSKEVDGKWRSSPFTFQLRDTRLIERYVQNYWGRNRFAVFFSPMEPIPFFSMISSLSLLREHQSSLIWAPFWIPASFEKRLCESDAETSAQILSDVDYYLLEGDGGRSVRIYTAEGKQGHE